jgi:hypothetical protein
LKDYLINGSNTSGLDPFDRGLAYGDGVFRTFKVIDGKPLLWVVLCQVFHNRMTMSENDNPKEVAFHQ